MPFLHSSLFFFSFWSHHMACGILVPWPGIEPTPPAVEVQSLHHWTAREVPSLFLHSSPVMDWSFNFTSWLTQKWDLLYYCCRKGDPFQGLRVGACLTLGNELSEETHILTKQKTLLGRGARVESSRVREPRRKALPCGLQSQVLRRWG